jgi:sterol 14-demethylase
MQKRTPPAMPGLPVVGNLLDFYRDRGGLLRRGYEQLGPVFGLRLGPKRAAVLIGPDHTGLFFAETDGRLSMQEAYKFVIPMFGEPVGFAGGPEVYRAQRPIYLELFKGKHMPGYVRVMAEEVHAWLDSLGESGEFEVVSTFERVTRHVAAHAFLGSDFRRRTGDAFWALFQDLIAGIDPVLPPWLPLPRFLRRDRARRKLHRMMSELIAERRADPGAHRDSFQDFLGAKLSDGAPLSDRLIIAIMLSLIFAGHETTSAQGSWALIQLLQHPEYLRRVRAEVDGVLSAAPGVDLTVLRELKHLAWALKETERMQPSADILLRYTAEPYEVGGYYVPKGWLTMISPRVSHRLPQVFPEPDHYDPLRFAPGREEDGQHRYALAGFGGGTHRCTGMSFAYNEMTVILALLLQRYELELLTPDPKPVREMRASRPSPCRIRYRRRAADDGRTRRGGSIRAENVAGGVEADLAPLAVSD